ncbi:hypothetical protein C8R43DRAFT_954592 [Mycena crocata]|nr:hypothetical protein C8R43DRAFT_954592 [Mycena crocata]
MGGLPDIFKIPDVARKALVTPNQPTGCQPHHAAVGLSSSGDAEDIDAEIVVAAEDELETGKQKRRPNQQEEGETTASAERDERRKQSVNVLITSNSLNSKRNWQAKKCRVGASAETSCAESKVLITITSNAPHGTSWRSEIDTSRKRRISRDYPGMEMGMAEHWAVQRSCECAREIASWITAGSIAARGSALTDCAIGREWCVLGQELEQCEVQQTREDESGVDWEVVLARARADTSNKGLIVRRKSDHEAQ